MINDFVGWHVKIPFDFLAIFLWSDLLKAVLFCAADELFRNVRE